MLKPNSTFKLSKTTKRMLALTKWTSKEQRDSWKRSMIQAELAEKIVPKSTGKRDSGTVYKTADTPEQPTLVYK